MTLGERIGRRSTVAAAIAFAATLSAYPVLATSDFRDMPYLSVKVSKVLESTPTGLAVTWSNPETGNFGEITVNRTYYMTNGSPCREYTRTTERPGTAPSVDTGTGCREPDGQWTLFENAPTGGGPTPLLPSSAGASPSASPGIDTMPLPDPIPSRSPEEVLTTARIEPASPIVPAEAAATPTPGPVKNTAPKTFSTTMPTRSD